MPSSDPATALADCSQTVLKTPISQWPDRPITQFLPVDFSQHNVDAPNRRYHVGNQLSFAHLAERLQIGEAGRAHVHSVRLRGAIADDVIPHLSTRRLHRLVNLTRWNCETFRNNLEVIDERLHLRLHLLAL